MAICAFYKRRRNHMQLISGHKGGQYLRLMAISTTEMFGTIPLGTFYMVLNAKLGVSPWTGWASMHNHYSQVDQVAGFIWKNEPLEALGLEMFRWSLVACAFLFFALFGFTFEAREQYYGLYKFLTRVTKQMSTSSSALHGAPHAYVGFVHRIASPDSSGLTLPIFCSSPSVPYAKGNGGATGPIRVTVQTDREKDDSSISLTLTDQASVLSISMESTRNSDSTTVQDSHSDTDAVSFYTAKSFDESGMQYERQLTPPPGITLLTVPRASVPPHFPGAPESMMPTHASPNVETV